MIHPGTCVGPFLVRRYLATGATSTVYEAEDDHGNQVALKVLHPEHDDRPDLLARFLSEARMIRALDLAHQGLPRVFAFDVPSVGPAYIAMELLGASLTADLRGGPLPLPGALQVIAQTADVLAFLHSRQIIHRDVKPDNVAHAVPGQTLSDPPPLIGIKLIDLGQAKLPSGAPEQLVSTDLGNRCGTPEYRAPEQWICAKTVSDRADVYSLGVVLFELITGHPPFREQNLGRLRLAHAMADPPALPGPPAVRALFLAMVEKDPTERPSAAAVASTLRAMLAT